MKGQIITNTYICVEIILKICTYVPHLPTSNTEQSVRGDYRSREHRSVATPGNRNPGQGLPLHPRAGGVAVDIVAFNTIYDIDCATIGNSMGRG